MIITLYLSQKTEKDICNGNYTSLNKNQTNLQIK